MADNREVGYLAIDNLFSAKPCLIGTKLRDGSTISGHIVLKDEPSDTKHYSVIAKVIVHKSLFGIERTGSVIYVTYCG